MKGEVKEADLSSLSREVLTGVNSPRGPTLGNTQGPAWGGFQEQPGSYLANLQHMGECAQAGQLPRGLIVLSRSGDDGVFLALHTYLLFDAGAGGTSGCGHPGTFG